MRWVTRITGSIRRRWKRLAAGTLCLGLCLFLIAWSGGCARPVEGVWPPGPGEKSYRMIVSIDRWHSVIGIWPPEDPMGEGSALIEEWGYGEKGYYLDGDSGCCGALRALFVPSAGVVQVTRAGRPWSERTYQPPARQWSFPLSEAGNRRLKEHLQGERRGERIISRGPSSRWYRSRRDYHAFHNCHHWTARALRAAGLPVWSALGLFRWSLAAQLDRAEGFLSSG